jgi:hypothetical protein
MKRLRNRLERNKVAYDDDVLVAPIIKRGDATDEDLLYELYSLDFLKYLMNMLNQLKSSLDTLLPQTDPIRDKKVLIYRYEIVARFCQFAESLGGLILGYIKLNLDSNRQLNNNHAIKILESLSGYTIGEIDDLYKRIDANSSRYDLLFGYDILEGRYANEVSHSLENIKTSLKEISDCYLFYKGSYNAYKHGYRLWFGKDNIKNIEAAIFRNKQGKEDHKPIDDNSLKIVMKSGVYCLHIFDLIKNNHKAILKYLRDPQTRTIKIKFLLNKNGDPIEMTCAL